MRKINDKLEKDHLEDRHELERKIRDDTIKKDVEINSLQEEIRNTRSFSKKFEKSTLDLNNLLHQQRDVKDR